ncbi:MAG: hypothetical protein AAF282_12195 [Cyanobacteria bacterium P01_A01_bin.15]
MTAWVTVAGKVIAGHGVASGRVNNPRFPGGTIRMQQPQFAARGLRLDTYFLGTINVSICPYRYQMRQAKHTFRQVKWANDAPPEDFSFFDCRVGLGSNQRVGGLIYYPHPETKPEHFQDPGTLEVLTRFIDGLSYGTSLELDLDPAQVLIHPDSLGQN